MVITAAQLMLSVIVIYDSITIPVLPQLKLSIRVVVAHI